jgi:hypothetical protein
MLAAIDRRLDAILQSGESNFRLSLTLDSNTVELSYVGTSLTCSCAGGSFVKDKFWLATEMYNGYWPLGDIVTDAQQILSFLKTDNITLIQFDNLGSDTLLRTIFKTQTPENRLTIDWLKLKKKL